MYHGLQAMFEPVMLTNYDNMGTYLCMKPGIAHSDQPSSAPVYRTIIAESRNLLFTSGYLLNDMEAGRIIDGLEFISLGPVGNTTSTTRYFKYAYISQDYLESIHLLVPNTESV